MPFENRVNENLAHRQAVVRNAREVQSMIENTPLAEQTPEQLRQQVESQKRICSGLVRENRQLEGLLELEKERNRQNGVLTQNFNAADVQRQLDELTIVADQLMEQARFKAEEMDNMLAYIRQLESDKEELQDHSELVGDQLRNLNLENERYFERNKLLTAILKVVEEQRDFMGDELNESRVLLAEQMIDVSGESSRAAAAEEQNGELEEKLLVKDERIMELERQRDEDSETSLRNNATLLETQSQTLDGDSMELDMLTECVAHLEFNHNLSEEQRQTRLINYRFDALRRELLARNVGQTDHILELENLAESQALDLMKANKLIAINLERNERFSYADLETAYLHSEVEVQQLQRQVAAYREAWDGIDVNEGSPEIDISNSQQ